MPFPISALLARIEARLPRLPSGETTLKRALIPLGRSLTRRAPAPDFFGYPRLVVAVATEPQNADLPEPILLKDRLFLGYQEHANAIEVISYNPAAGRFEFQEVINYGPGLKAEVRYSNRALCMSCHQNGGPIFSRASWDETNANEGISSRLREHSASFYGVDVDPDTVEQIDSATDRANLIPRFSACGVRAAWTQARKWQRSGAGQDSSSRPCSAV